MRSPHLGRTLLTATVLALVATASAQAALSFRFSRAAARPGSTVAAYQPDFFAPPAGVVVYLIPTRPRGVRPDAGGGYLLAKPPRQDATKLGRIGIIAPRRIGIRFRVPRLRPGDYTTGFWCPTCTRGGDFFASALWGQPWTGRPGTVLRTLG